MEIKHTYQCNKCGYTCSRKPKEGNKSTHLPDGFNYCRGKFKQLSWISVESLKEWIDEIEERFGNDATQDELLKIL